MAIFGEERPRHAPRQMALRDNRRLICLCSRPSRRWPPLGSYLVSVNWRRLSAVSRGRILKYQKPWVDPSIAATASRTRTVGLVQRGRKTAQRCHPRKVRPSPEGPTRAQRAEGRAEPRADPCVRRWHSAAWVSKASEVYLEEGERLYRFETTVNGSYVVSPGGQ